jgi:ABC-2 type transport system ATP-binding protein
MPVIEVKNLVKEYKVVKKEKGLKGALKSLFVRKKELLTAVNNISFAIEPGEIVGYIGPNGAGKSTTVKMLSGILTPTSGEVIIDGLSPLRDRKAVVRRIGVVFGQRSQLNWDLRLGESFELLKRIYRVDDETYDENIKVMDEILEIGKIIDTPVRQLSLGQRMRGDLAAAMLHSPKILFLDEPTIGLDVDGKYAIRKFIKEVNETRNTTIILTTHDLDDIQELCTRIVIINHGDIIEDGALEEITNRIAPYKYLNVEFYKRTEIEHPKAEIVERTGSVAKYKFLKSEISAARLISDISEKGKVKDISIEEVSIDEVIRIAYRQDEKREGADP